MGQHDLSYRLFFTHRRMIQDLLLKIVKEPWVEHIDFDSAELVNTSFVSGRHDSRDSDIVWKFRRTDGQEPADLYILVAEEGHSAALRSVAGGGATQFGGGRNHVG